VFSKKREESAGVERQWNSRHGKGVNCHSLKMKFNGGNLKMSGLHSGMNISRTPTIDWSRSTAQPQGEARTEPDRQNSSAPSTSNPNRTAHERQKLHQLQRMLGETSGANSELPSISHRQVGQASGKNEEPEISLTPHSEAGSLATRSRSKMPEMARVLSKFLPAFGMKVSSRKKLQDKLIKLKDHFEKVKAENWSPDEHEFYRDKAFLPIAVKAENARRPELNLHNFEDFESFADAVKKGALQNGRALFPLPEKTAHTSVADIRTIGNKVSILVLESFSLDPKISESSRKSRKRYVFDNVPIMISKLPENARMAVLYIDAQKSSNDCPIFALSNASKLAKESEFVGKAHEENLSESSQFGPFHFPNVRLFNAHKWMPASFHKHTQSLPSLRKSTDQDSLTQTPVNKKSDTLLSRYNKYVVERHKRYPNEDTLRPLRFSASIEEKRLTYLDRAIAYLNDAPEQEITALLRKFNEAMKLNKKLNKKLASVERNVGPQRQ